MQFLIEHSSTIYIIVIFIFLINNLGNAFLGRWLAAEKHRDSTAWFWICLFLGIPALLVLGLSQTIDIRKIAHRINESITPDMSVTWECPRCSIKNPNNLYTCKECGYKLA